MDGLIRDVRYALRGLRSSPGFALVAVVTLALGIGVNSTIFSLVNAVLFRPLPVEAPGELVDIYGHTATSTSHDSNSYPNYLDFREQTETLTGLAAYANFFGNLSVEGRSELVIGESVSDNYFQMLGVRPAMGRPFLAEEFETVGAAPVTILSHRFWQTRFGGAPDILDRTLRINGTVYDIVGVAPERFGGMFPAVTAQLWIPLAMIDEVEPIGSQRNSGAGGGPSILDRRGRHFLWMRGRMAPGVEVEQVRAEMTALSDRLAAAYPETNAREQVTVLRTSDIAINPDFDSTIGPAGLILLGAVGLVLLVACANLANMMLARASTKRRELAVRVAIGASRGRVIRSMLTESLLVAFAGGTVAVFLALWLTGIMARFQPPLPIDIGLEISPDWRVFVFTFGVAVLTGIAFGLIPALRASRPDLVPALKDSGRSESRAGRRFDLRDGLVVAQVAFSLLLLVTGALMVRSLGAAARVDLGYPADRVAYLSMALEMNGYEPDEGRAFIQAAKVRLEALPEVEGVALASRLPQSLNSNGFGIYIDGHQSSDNDAPYIMDGASVGPGYFDVLGLRIIDGRGIEAADQEEDRSVAVITETMAARYWPNGSAVGREFRSGWEGRPIQVVGVVEDYKVDTPGEAPKPYIHLPLTPSGSFANFMVRTATTADPLVPDLEREVRTLDPDLVFLETGTIRGMADVRVFPVRAGAVLIGAFGLLALLLAGVGLYGVIALSVSQRVREIGIRKALGAETTKLVGLVLRRGMLLVLAGGALGAIMAAGAAQLLSSALYVPALDVLSYLAAFLILAAVAALANLVPAHRASAIEPVVALRGE